MSEDMLRELRICGFTPILLPPDRCLGNAISSHPDSLLFLHRNQIITTAEYCDIASYVFADIREFVPNIKIHFTDDKTSNKYPEDCKMNAFVMADKLFCKSDSVSHGIIDYAKKNGFKICHTNQGYPACSVLRLGDSHAITGDKGLYKILLKEGISTLLIEEGNIALPPYDYGFIGGAAGVSGDTVYFLGNTSLHPDGDKIETFISGAGYKSKSLSPLPLVDLGGIVFPE